MISNLGFKAPKVGFQAHHKMDLKQFPCNRGQIVRQTYQDMSENQDTKIFIDKKDTMHVLTDSDANFMKVVDSVAKSTNSNALEKSIIVKNVLQKNYGITPATEYLPEDNTFAFF